MNALRRSRSHVVRSAGKGFLTLAALGWTIVACQGSESGSKSAPPPAADSLIPGTQIVRLYDCPHDWRGYVSRLPNPGPDGNFRAVGIRTQVVEYHDCQKFIDQSGHGYDQLVAIFASTSVSPTPTQLAAATATSPVALASALILDFDSPYNNLHIESGFNCLYLYYDGSGYIARMQSFPTEPDCHLPADINAIPPNTPALEAREAALPVGSAGGYTTADVPDVARWDYDPAPGRPTYYAGLKCGAHWCEIGTAGFNPSRGRLGSPGSSNRRRRVMEIKGWNDYQKLALKNPTGPTYPGTLAGYVTPDGDLENRDLAAFQNKWVHVATIELDGPPGVYQAKLGLGAPTPANPQNHLWMCNGAWNICQPASQASGGPAAGTAGTVAKPDCSGDPGNPETWWSATVDPGNQVAFRCVHREDHGTIPVPGTARWRWILNDETIWVRCANGCCQVVHL